MTVYPFALDSDETITRIDDNLSELGTEVINQLRSAVFAMEKELGIKPSGSLTSVASRLDVSINPNGTIKSSALTSVGLATLPIDNSQVGASAGIRETKLALDYSTADLKAQITTNSALLTTTSAFAATTNADLLSHIAGATVLSDAATAGRHVASHIDINATPFDPRDISFNWTGLLDKDGNPRSATTVAQALLQINNAFVEHQLDSSGGAHTATGIFVDTSQFTVIPQSADTVQKSLQAIDDANTIVIQQHQANQHSNGVPKESRSVTLNNVDGYSTNIIPPTSASAYLVIPPYTSPVDNNTIGDDIISFNPDNTNNLFDEKFAKVSIGDVVRINYGNGIEGVFNVESKRHTPGSEWIVRINGTNLYNADGYSSFARIDKKRFETNNWGTMAVASANNDIDNTIMSSVIVGNPKAARVLGISFDSTHLDSSHYNLYLALYPDGDPNNAEIILPPIDVTGDLGISPGKYTLEGIVQTVNNAFRSGGYNYRFMAFSHDGEFGIMMTDSIGNASFSIINGQISAGSLISGSYANNVVGDASDGKDALGFGYGKAAVASPKFTASYSSSIGASIYPTVLHFSLDKRTYSVNGISRDSFAPTYSATNGYWDGYVSNRVPVGATTVEITYDVPLDLTRAKLKPGKTITVQPAIERTNVLFNDVDYGRFVIKSVNFNTCCPESGVSTSITVVNGLHATGSPIGVTGIPPLPVRLYFGEDSVSFNDSNVIDGINTTQYFRYHEIFINEEGETFSHERARMPVQAESINSLNTNNFKIKAVSPKLKGFTDDGASDVNKYVRFMVTRYDSVSGEFDGYLGKRVPSTNDIYDYGRLVTGRKQVPTRFYDNTDVDFIEIEYTETNQYPGTSILSTDSQRYVDIEIFDTLALNQENFRLAGCGLVANRVETITDIREFGNISEIDFTDSAIRFIESGDRHLHENGVIQGFTFKGEDESLPGTLKFNGGIALVNGHMSTLNAQSVSIPEIVQDTGAGQTNTLDWAICVNDRDLLEAIPLTSTKQHFFARRTSDTNNYYIQSVTFDELVNNRKDLTIIYIANVTIASVTVNSVTDARKFGGQNFGSYTVSQVATGSVEYNTTFRSAESLINWAKYSNINEVTIVGDFYIDTAVDFTTLNSRLKIKGGTVTCESSIGFILNENIEIDGVSFIYNYTVPSDVSDLTHIDDKIACISMPEAAGNIEIYHCTFSQTVTGDRPPYIAYFNDSPDSPTIDNVKIYDNVFEESSNSLNCAIAFNLFSTASSDSDPDTERFFDNIHIYKNRIYGQQSILVTSDSSSFKPITRGIKIDENYMPDGVIGYRNATDISTTTLGGINVGIRISNNLCHSIISAESNGTTATGYGHVGNSHIVDNTCVLIQIFCSGTESGTIIRGNKLYARDIITEIGVSLYRAISAFGDGPCIVTENHIHYNSRDSISYDVGIITNNNACISNNFIHELSFAQSGIIASDNCVVTGNHVYRGAQDINNFIQLTGTGSICKNNIFDSRYTDIAETITSTISYGEEQYITGNVNHLNTVRVSGYSGQAGIKSSSPTVGNSGSILTYASPASSVTPATNVRDVVHGDYGINFVHAGNSGIVRTFAWNVPITDLLPEGALLVSATVSFQNATADNTGNGTASSPQARLRLMSNGAQFLNSGYVDLTATLTTFNATISSNIHSLTRTSPSMVLESSIEAINNTSNVAAMYIFDLDVTYTF